MEFTRRFKCTKADLTRMLDGFPGTYRIYGIDRWPGGQRLHVEFRTENLDAADKFLDTTRTRGYARDMKIIETVETPEPHNAALAAGAILAADKGIGNQVVEVDDGWAMVADDERAILFHANTKT